MSSQSEKTPLGKLAYALAVIGVSTALFGIWVFIAMPYLIYVLVYLTLFSLISSLILAAVDRAMRS